MYHYPTGYMGYGDETDTLRDPMVVLQTSSISSPMTAIPAQHNEHSEYFPENLELEPHYTISSSSTEEMALGPQSLSRVSRSQHSRMLKTHIKKLAEGAKQGENHEFAFIYQLAQGPVVKEQIQSILSRPDLSGMQKVDGIAALLRRHSQKYGSRPASTVGASPGSESSSTFTTSAPSSSHSQPSQFSGQTQSKHPPLFSSSSIGGQSSDNSLSHSNHRRGSHKSQSSSHSSSGSNLTSNPSLSTSMSVGLNYGTV